MEAANCAYVNSPCGWLRLEGDGRRLTAIRFVGRSHPRVVGPDVSSGVFEEAARQLEAYFAGRLTTFDLPLAPRGTPFQLDVWNALRRIPYGKTISYAEQARRIGRPAAVRAVGAANGRNPLSIVIPCHRVIGSDGTLTGYAAGLDVKRRLLSLEGAL